MAERNEGCQGAHVLMPPIIIIPFRSGITPCQLSLVIYFKTLYICPSLNVISLAFLRQPNPEPAIDRIFKKANMKLFIKYMVSLRCKMMVKSELKNLGLHYIIVKLGEVEIMEDITDEQHDQLKNALLKSGLELMDDKKAILVERTKNVIVEMIHYADELPKVKKSIYISEKLNYDYTYISNIFAEATGITLEHFIIAHKIERAKELIIYNELNLSEIADRLHYSSVAHLSKQFKKVTGLTPSFFKSLKRKKRLNLENI
jgi:AraC-like DNA-binding protein